MENKDKDYLLYWITLLIITLLLIIGNLHAQTPTKKELYTELKKQNVINPGAAFQICMVETGHLKSKYAKEYNNLFGLRNSCGYMEFKSWKDCILYFKNLECKWHDKFIKENTGTYYDFIAWWGYKTGKGCAIEDIKYSEYLKKINIKY